MKCAAGFIVFASLVLFVSAETKSWCDYQPAEFATLATCVRTALGDGDLAKKLVTVRTAAGCADDACILQKLCQRTGQASEQQSGQFTAEEKAEIRRVATACGHEHH